MALTLRAVGGLTTREIADAFYVPEATMAQRISRAKRTLHGRPLDQPGDLAVVLRVLYLVYTTGHAGRVDLAAEAIRLARQLTLATEEPEARGLLALMLLNHARPPARFDSEGRIVTLDRQDRGLWDTREIAEGVRVLQSALAAERPGRYQVEAAIAALHDDAASAEETDWPQILAWYDDLVALTDDPVRQDPAAVLGRAVAVGHVLGAAAGLRETDRLREVIGERHRWHAVRGHLHELAGDLPAAAAAYAEAARRATNVAERDHLVRQAARARAAGARSRSAEAGVQVPRRPRRHPEPAQPPQAVRSRRVAVPAACRVGHQPPEARLRRERFATTEEPLGTEAARAADHGSVPHRRHEGRRRLLDRGVQGFRPAGAEGELRLDPRRPDRRERMRGRQRHAGR